MQEEMLTSQEATKAFKDAGLSETTFRQRVRDGLIKKHMPENRQRGALYPKSQVLAAIGKAAQTPKKIKRAYIPVTPAIFSQATPADMPEMAVLLETFYKAKISVEKRSAWMERNPQVAYILRHEGKLVGCAFIMPLPEGKIMEILENQVKPPTRPHEIELYEPGKRYCLYSRATGVLQSVSKNQRRHWAASLINGLVREVIKLGENGIYIDKIYAQGDTIQGVHALRSLGFMQIDLKAPTARKNFVLDIPKSGSSFAMSYKHALNTWRTQNEEE